MNERPPHRSARPIPHWLHESAVELVTRVRERGMTLTLDSAETFLAERHSIAAKQLGITEHSAKPYLDDVALEALADRLVATFATEEPGGDLFTLPRTAHISVASFGLLIAGLAETLLFFEAYPAIDEDDRRARRQETTQLLSLAGLIQSAHADGAIAAPPAMFSRIARTLTNAADLTDNADLAVALRRDAMRARTAATTADKS
ncbi:hypothetical protein JF770_15050 [Mycobacterium intracellulare]|nr:hypothetical protein [Mycobacterium intracellulare]MCA2347087.1 hypothetical protein [Mycobacterium intracellulare]